MGRNKTQNLAVYQNRKKLGRLTRATTGAISFTYEPDWLAAPEACPISLSLPLREDAYKGAEVSAFFDNLLPDNVEIRNRVAERVKADSARTFDLLSAIGHDCVGALQFLDERTPPPFDDKGDKIDAKPLSDSAIAKNIKSLGFFPLGMQETEPDFRISIAGAHDPTPIQWTPEVW